MAWPEACWCANSPLDTLHQAGNLLQLFPGAVLNHSARTARPRATALGAAKESMALPSPWGCEPFVNSSRGPQGCSSADLAVPAYLGCPKNKNFGKYGRLHLRSCRGTAAEGAQLWGAHPWPAIVPGPNSPCDASLYTGSLARRCLGPSRTTLLHSIPCMRPPSTPRNSPS